MVRSSKLWGILFVLLAVVSPAALPAQAPDSGGTTWPPPVAAGTRVRLALGRAGACPDHFAERWCRIAGEVVAVTPDSVYLRVHPAMGPAPVARAAVRRLEVSRGRSQWRTVLELATKGTLWGALGGNAMHDFRVGNFASRTRLDAIRVGAALGAATGAYLGLFERREHWRRVEWQP